MNNVDELCFSCMNKKSNGAVCPKCGFDNRSYTAPMHHLNPGTILNGKYIIGKALGEGGFGITYIAYDLNLEMRLAIKEYFPNGFVSRDVSNTDTVTIFSGSDMEMYETGRNKFINEAKTLAKFDNMPGIVSVKDFFLENGTAYIVMEYIDGETLKCFLERNGGKTSAESIFVMMEPLIKSLSHIHSLGLIHRDISPDNIMITPGSQIKLLDFGAARDISADGQRSLSIQLKPGYAPEEQYRSHGKQGTWTDVYALCATIYKAVTGVQPLESLERIQNDTLPSPAQLGADITPAQDAAIMHGMAVFADRRIPDMNTLYDALYNGVSSPAPSAAPRNIESYTAAGNSAHGNKDQKVLLAAAAVCGVLVLSACITLAVIAGGRIAGKKDADKKDNDGTLSTAAVQTAAPTPTPLPAPVMTSVSASSTRGTDSEGGQYSKEAVLSQDPMTKWVPSKVSGNGRGEWIQISASTPQYVRGVRILNGYHKNESTWRKNNRVRNCSITFSSGETRSFALDDTMNMITLDFGGVVETTSVRLTIESVYKGTSWNDTAVTYLGVY